MAKVVQVNRTSLTYLYFVTKTAGSSSFREFSIFNRAIYTATHPPTIADTANRAALAENLRRAAELTCIPNEEILSMYNTLRPHRSTRKELEDLCYRLEKEYGALTTARFIRDAISVYDQKGLLRRGEGR